MTVKFLEKLPTVNSKNMNIRFDWPKQRRQEEVLEVGTEFIMGLAKVSDGPPFEMNPHEYEVLLKQHAKLRSQ